MRALFAQSALWLSVLGRRRAGEAARVQRRPEVMRAAGFGTIQTAIACAALLGGLSWIWKSRRLQHNRRGGLPRTKLLPRGPLIALDDEVSLVTYNILCQKFATRQRLPHVFPRWLEWEHRWRLLRDELSRLQADVVCLQEVTPEYWFELKDHMATLGYASVLQEKAQTHGSQFLLATFYRAAKLRLVWQEERSRALLTGLELRQAEGQGQADKTLWVVNLHLEGSPYRPNDRVSQLKSALQRLTLHLGGDKAAEAADVVIAGDFNSFMTDSPCWYLRRGRLERNHTDAVCPAVPTTKQTIAHPFALKEAYEAAGIKLHFSRKTYIHNIVIDFIWVARHIQVSAVMRPLQADQRAYVDKHYLPNRLQPSDHLPLGCILRLRPSAAAEGDLELRHEPSLPPSEYEEEESDGWGRVPVTHPPAPAEHPANGLSTTDSDSRPPSSLVGEEQRPQSRGGG